MKYYPQQSLIATEMESANCKLVPALEGVAITCVCHCVDCLLLTLNSTALLTSLVFFPHRIPQSLSLPQLISEKTVSVAPTTEQQLMAQLALLSKNGVRDEVFSEELVNNHVSACIIL